jgi:hypothetical protein
MIQNIGRSRERDEKEKREQNDQFLLAMVSNKTIYLDNSFSLH